MGLNFQSMTIVNSDKDFETGKDLFKAVVGQKFRFLRHYDFYKNSDVFGKITKVTKALGALPTYDKVTIDLNGLLSHLGTANFLRLKVYLGLNGAEPFIFHINSPQDVLHGIPFYFEFKASEVANTGAAALALAKKIKDNLTFRIGKDLVDVTVPVADDTTNPITYDSKITLTSKEEWIRFKEVTIDKWDAVDTEYSDNVARLGDTTTIIAHSATPKNGFGTYSHLTKDLVLPTIENLRNNHLRQNEIPVVGNLYDQYIIEYKAPAPNDGMQFVGQRGENVTTHVFWVNKTAKGANGSDSISDLFSNAIALALGTPAQGGGQDTPKNWVQTNPQEGELGYQNDVITTISTITNA